MNNVLEYPPFEVAEEDLPPSRSAAVGRSQWLWWLFLAGVAACGCLGPASACH